MLSHTTCAILIVDDEPTARENLERLLRTNGYETVVAADGQEALQRLSEQEFEVVLLDIRMPGLSGMDVLRRVDTDHSDTSVIMITAVAEVDAAVEAMKLGAYDWVTKPFNLDDILFRIEKARERRYLALQVRDYQNNLEEKVKEQTRRLEQQLVQLIQSLAREHTLVLESGVSRQSGHGYTPFPDLPPKLQKPMGSAQEFAQALLEVIRSGNLESS